MNTVNTCRPNTASTAEPTNQERAARAMAALKTYAVFKNEMPDSESDVVDFLADLMHWCCSHGHNFKAAVATAKMHFNAEVQQ